MEDSKSVVLVYCPDEAHEVRFYTKVPSITSVGETLAFMGDAGYRMTGTVTLGIDWYDITVENQHYERFYFTDDSDQAEIVVLFVPDIGVWDVPKDLSVKLRNNPIVERALPSAVSDENTGRQ